MSERAVTWETGLKALGLLAVLGFVFSVQYLPHMATFENPAAEDEPGLVQLGVAWTEYLAGEREGFPWSIHVDEHYHASTIAELHEPRLVLGVAWTEYLAGEREGFPWSIHVDEHYHASTIAEIQREDRLIPPGPYAEDHGEFTPLGSLRGAVHERGYHVFMAQVQELTGVSTLELYQYGPALWTTLIAFGVFAMVRPNPAALPAAAFVALLPTSVRFLGTGFLVPIGFSLAWLPATAILTEPAKRRSSAAALLLGVVAWAFFVHLVAGFAAVAIVLAIAVFSSGDARRSTLKLALLSALPVAWLWRSFSAGIQGELQREASLPRDFTIFDNFGLITMGIWVFGVALYWLVPPEERETRPTLAAFSTLSIVALGLIVASVTFDLNRYATYSRMHPIYFLTATVPIGFAIAFVAGRCYDYARGLLDRVDQASSRARWRAATAGLIALAVGLSAAGPAASQAVGYHASEGYYRVMDERSWQAMEALEANLSAEDPYEVFLTDPWQAPVLFEKTGMHPHTVGEPGGPPGNAETWRAYLNGEDTLRDYVMNDITVVLGPREPAGDVWRQEADDVWVMEEPYAEQVQRLRQSKSLQLDRLPANSS